MFEASTKIWRSVFLVQLTLFAGAFFVVLSTPTLALALPLGEIAAWTMTFLSFMGIVASLAYGFIVQPLARVSQTTELMRGEVATREAFNSLTEDLSTAVEAIRLAAKDLLVASSDCGLTMIYRERGTVESELSTMLEKARKEVRLLGICISELRSIPKLEEILSEKATSDVKLQFLFMKRDTQNSDFDFYRQRAKDEYYPKTVGDLKSTTSTNIEILQGVRSSLSPSAQDNIQIREYEAFPYMNLIIVDDDLFISTYLFGEMCAISPEFRFERKSDGVYDLYYDHFSKLWDASAKAEAKIDEDVSS